MKSIKDRFDFGLFKSKAKLPIAFGISSKAYELINAKVYVAIMLNLRTCKLERYLEVTGIELSEDGKPASPTISDDVLMALFEIIDGTDLDEFQKGLLIHHYYSVFNHAVQVVLQDSYNYDITEDLTDN